LMLCAILNCPARGVVVGGKKVELLIAFCCFA
jgi:hypothetical protein